MSLSKIVPSAHHVTPGCSRVLGFPSCLVFVYRAEDTADRDQTKPVRDPALAWTVWPSGQSDSKQITQQAWLSEHQCLKQQDSFPLQWPVVQIQRHTRPRRGCRDAVPPPHPGGRSLAGGATRTQNYLSNLCDAHTFGHFDGTSHRRGLDLPRFTPCPWGRCLEDPTRHSSTGTPTSPVPPCITAFASPFSTRTAPIVWSSPRSLLRPRRNYRHHAIAHPPISFSGH